MTRNLRIAVVGAGSQAQSIHLPVLRRRWDRFEIAALVDISPRRRREAADVFGIPEEQRYESVADLIADIRARKVSIDGAVIASDGLHVDDVLAFAKRGIPVLVEPPVGFSVAEAQKVADFERMTGRTLVMVAHAQQYDPALVDLNERVPARDLRLLDYEVRMPSTHSLYGDANVTVSAYDLDSDLRAERRDALEAAVVAGAGEGSIQRDRDIWVKGLLTGMAEQLAAISAVYGPIDRIEAVRQWPEGVIPGSIEVLARVNEDAAVRLAWHFLPFAPEYDETITAITARKRARVEMAPASHLDERSVLYLREREGGAVQEVRTVADASAGDAMWEAFHAFIVGGDEVRGTVADELSHIAVLREILERIVAADGRSLEAPEPDPADEAGEVGELETGEPGAGETSADESGAPDAEQSGASDADQPGSVSEAPADGDGEEPAAVVATAPDADESVASETDASPAAASGADEPESVDASTAPEASDAPTTADPSTFVVAEEGRPEPDATALTPKGSLEPAQPEPGTGSDTPVVAPLPADADEVGPISNPQTAVSTESAWDPASPEAHAEGDADDAVTEGGKLSPDER